MSGIWIMSHMITWILLVLAFFAIQLLARQVGLINRRIPAVGAREGLAGPEIGSPVPEAHTRDLLGGEIRIGAESGRRSLLVFVSSTCPLCADLMPAVRSIARRLRRDTDTIVLSGSSEDAMREFAQEHDLLGRIPVVASFQREEEFGALATPYALVVDQSGIVRGQGAVNHVEHLGSLVTALDLSPEEHAEWRQRAVEENRVLSVENPSEGVIAERELMLHIPRSPSNASGEEDGDGRT